MSECISHHLACECREALLAELKAEVDQLRAIERVARNAARNPEDGGDRIMWALLYGEGVTDAN